MRAKFAHDTVQDTMFRRRRPAATPGVEPLEERRMLATIYVDWEDHNGSSANNGTSWQAAHTSLQSALSAAVSGDEIRVAGGTYKPTAGTDRTISFALRSGVAVRGGYMGYGFANPNARDIAGNPSTLSGDIGTSGDAADNSHHVVTASLVNSAATLDGFVITGGNAGGDDDNPNGGGLYSYRSTPAIIDCRFIANQAGQGGGMYDRGEPSPRLTNCSFIDNSASQGGGVYSFSSKASFTTCTFSGNSASDGGGMYNSSASPTLTGCTFTENQAGQGGGIYNNYATPALATCTFTRNAAAILGGAIANNASGGTVSACVFQGNTAGSYGGGVSNAASSTPVFTNSLFSGNSAGNGGGVYSNESSPSLKNCTLGGNAASFGGGISNSGAGGASLTGCIVSGNAGGAVNDFGSSPTIRYSIIEGGYAGLGNRADDPQFARLPIAGADGEWGTGDDDYGDLRVKLTSPAIDAGDNSALAAGGNDLAGRPRFTNVPGTIDTGTGASPIVDMGAYEMVPPVTLSGGNTLYLRCTADRKSLQVWFGSSPTGSPAQTHAWSDLTSCTFNTGPSAATIYLDFLNGSPIPAGGMILTGNSADQLIALADNDAARTTLLQYVRSQLSAGIIRSTRADATHAFSTHFIANSDIRMRLALYGDLNESGGLNGDDYFLMDQAFLTSGATLPQADLDYDGQITGGDYLLLDRTFLQLAPAPAPAAVPESAPPPATPGGQDVWDAGDGGIV